MKNTYHIVAIIIFILSEHLVAIDGTLDTTFNPTGPIPGIVLSSAGNQICDSSSVIVQADGRIINLLNGDVTMLLIRLNTIGQLDTSFGTGGIVNLGIAAPYTVDFPLNVGTLFFLSYIGLALQPDGKIIAAVGNGIPFSSLMRLMPDGTFDTNFISEQLTDALINLAVQPDNKIIAIQFMPSQEGLGSTVYRFNENGSRDISFGNQGRVAFTYYKQPISLAVQPDGKIVLAGTNKYISDQCNAFYVLRLLPDGSYDTSFGTNGEIIMPIPNKEHAIISSVAIQPDGTILAGGWGGNAGGTNNNFVLAKYTSDGDLDTTFGAGQGYVVNVDGAAMRSLAVQSDGKIIAVGYREDDYAFMIARYLSDGSLDTTGFGTDGVVTTTDLGVIFPSTIAVQSDGNIVVAGGYDFFTGYPGGALARYTVADTPLITTTISHPPSGQTFDTVPTFSGSAQNPSLMSIFINDTLNDADTVFTTSSYNEWSLTPTRSHMRTGVFPPGTYTYYGVSYYPNGRSQQATGDGTFTIRNPEPPVPQILNKVSLLSEQLLLKACAETRPATSDLAVALHNKVCDIPVS